MHHTSKYWIVQVDFDCFQSSIIFRSAKTIDIYQKYSFFREVKNWDNLFSGSNIKLKLFFSFILDLSLMGKYIFNNFVENRLSISES